VGLDGKIIKRKVRLVVKGYIQEKGIHYWDSWAMVARYESFRMLIAIAAHCQGTYRGYLG
jgi:hypothetical protein